MKARERWTKTHYTLKIHGSRSLAEQKIPVEINLTELHARMRQCSRCLDEGYDVVLKPIFAGSPDAQIMIIGQAPGITEVEAGRPFNAGSGSRLFQWLQEAGIEEVRFREVHYMTSVTKCFPGKAPSGSGDRVPSRAEQQFCRPFLDSEIYLINPKLIIPVGRLAINLFFPAGQTLSNLIGKGKQENGCWIIPLPHPSGASRWHQNSQNRERIKQAVVLISEALKDISCSA